jgi:hypothetical protein
MTSWRDVINGDFNGNGAVTLEDGILIFQVCSGMTPISEVRSCADVNEDSRIGLEESGYILQVVSGVRTQ